MPPAPDTTAPPASAEVKPLPGTVRYRSTFEIAHGAPAEAIDTLLDQIRDLLARDSQEIAPTGDTYRHIGRQMLHGLAGRHDLTPGQIRRICTHLDGSQWGIAITLLANPAARSHKKVRDLLDAETIPVLLDEAPDEFAADILRMLTWPRRWAPGPWPPADVTRFLTTLGPDRIARVHHDWFTRGTRTSLTQLAESAALDDTYFDHLLTYATAPTAKHRWDVLEVLVRRADLTDQRGNALVSAIRDAHTADKNDPSSRHHDSQEIWTLNTLAANQNCPLGAYQRMLVHRHRWVREQTLAHRHLPDTARWYAAQHQMPQAILDASGLKPIPEPVAATVLTDLARGTLRRRPVTDETRANVLDRLLTLTPTTALWHAIVDAHPHRTDPDFAAHLVRLVDKGHFAWAEQRHGTTRRDLALSFLASRSEGHLRAHVVPHLHEPDAVSAATSDPSPHVRAAAVAHPAFPSDRLAALADDPSPLVREQVARRFVTAFEDATT